MNDIDKKTAEEVSLKICFICGWYALRFPEHTKSDCLPLAGSRADGLKEAVAEWAGDTMEAGKLGYGSGHVYFKPDEDLTIRFSVGDRPKDPAPFRLDEVQLLDSLDRNEADLLVQAVTRWREQVLESRKSRKTKP